MQPRLKYGQLAPEGLARMQALEHYLNTATCLEPTLQELVRLLASTMNGVTAWRGSDLYTQRERAALTWTEAVTNIQQGHAPDAIYDEVRAHFSEVETVNLTLTIATINAWNRIAISLGADSHRG